MRFNHDDDRAQNGYEYMLIVGAIVVTMAAAFLTLDVAIAWFVGVVCPSVDTANALVAFGTCITS